MFAPKVAKPDVKAARSPIGSLAVGRSMVAGRPVGAAATGQVHLLQRSIGNQATLRLLAQRDSGPPETKVGDDGSWEKMTDREVRGPAGDFSKIAVSPPDPKNGAQSSYLFAATPVPSALQAKLVVGEADDPLEYEADRVADHVMRVGDSSLSLSPAPARITRDCAAGEEEMHRTAVSPSVAEGDAAPSLVYRTLAEPGRRLDARSRAFFEPR